MISLEAVVLTGGASRRMGQDKSKLSIDGVPQGERIVRQFLDAEIPVTVLGREAIDGANFQADKEEFGGPISALSAFTPKSDLVFVASCDLPRFDIGFVKLLVDKIGSAKACAPKVDGFRQPLCALYRNEAFAKLSALTDQCAMGWLDALETVILSEDDLVRADIDPSVTRGANTPDELRAVLNEVNS